MARPQGDGCAIGPLMDPPATWIGRTGRVQVRDPKAHAASVQAGPAAAEVYHYYDCAMQSTQYARNGLP